MSQLTEKESRVFADWYMERYWLKDENGEYITPVEIPDVLASEQEEDMKEWAKIIYKMLWKNKVDKTYKYRTYIDWTRKRETMFEKAFNSLFLQYWPRYVEEDWSVAKKYLWLDDVINVQEFIKTWKL